MDCFCFFGCEGFVELCVDGGVWCEFCYCVEGDVVVCLVWFG